MSENNDKVTAFMSPEEEHKLYHLEVALEGCGVPDCDFGKAVAIHFQALHETEPSGRKEQS